MSAYATATRAPRGAAIAAMLNKVPEVTIFFWIIKVLATTVGETAADFLSTTLHLGLTNTSYIIGAVFLVVLGAQLKARRYIPALYWSVVVLISIVGTLISDNLTDNMGVTLTTTSAVFAGVLVVVFALWWLNERTLSVHAITTTRRELFYWAAILFTFALGTSAGDLMAQATGIGFAWCVLSFAAMIGAVALARCGLKINGILAFWLVYILTRPLGASLGDLLSQPVKDGGLGFGTSLTSLAFVTTIVALVWYLTVTGRDRLENTANAQSS